MLYALTASFAKTESISGRWNQFGRKIPNLRDYELQGSLLLE